MCLPIVTFGATIVVMEFFHRAPRTPCRLAIFPGAFNPPTRAHLALAEAALSVADEVVFVVPRAFPHKPFDGASFEERVELLRASLAGTADFSIAATEKGLFVDIAGACRDAYGAQTSLAILCGRDAAERSIEWDYGQPGAVADMLSVCELLVASRRGSYSAPEEFRHRIRTLEVDGTFDLVSATDVRNRIERGEEWQHLVPEAIAGEVGKIYSRRRLTAI